MRWFIEVSTVGSGDTDTEYCVEAKQWQAALQQARKLRGEAGPLSAFSIELLDSGYRAVDKKQNLKYVVKKAPNDAPLNDGKNGASSVVAAGAADGELAAGAEGRSEASDPEASREPSAPAHQVATPSRGSGPPPKPRLVSSRPPADDAGDIPREKEKGAAKSASPPAKKSPQKVAELLAAAAMKASNRPTAPSTAPGRLGASPSNAPRPVSGAGLATTALAAHSGEIAPAHEQRAGVVSSRVLALDEGLQDEGLQKDALQPAEVASDTPTPGAPSTTAVEANADLPDFEVIRTRGEEPSKETPITYREVALGVHPGVTKSATRTLMLTRYRSIVNEIAAHPKGKFVQIAVFDHVFGQKPMRPPLATLVWKDWRGEPVLAFPGFSGDSVQPPPPLGEPAMGSLRPISVIPVGEDTGSRPPPPKEVASSSTQKGVPADADNTSSAQTQDSAGAQAAANTISEQAAARATSTSAGAQSSISIPTGVVDDRSGAGVTVDEVLPLQKKKARDSRPSLKRTGDPSSDDLILDLFERMHELHFMADVVNGSEFVLRVVKHTLPSAFVLIHVFDINTKNFVVVRQLGGNGEKLLMFQTPDTDPLVRKVMRASRTLNVPEADAANELGDGRWKVAGVPIGPLLVGPVKQGGRYLGMIEIGNPTGAKAFADTEANALDYICEQFAEFLTNRPIVLDADVILK